MRTKVHVAPDGGRLGCILGHNSSCAVIKSAAFRNVIERLQAIGLVHTLTIAKSLANRGLQQ